MKGFSRFLFCMTVASVLPLVAGAAGTYYNGNLYQNPQAKYGAMTNNGNNGNGGGFYNNYVGGRGYGQNMQNIGVTKTTTTVKKSTSKTDSAKKKGLYMGIGATHEFANWDFEMKTAGSNLHYDNLRWNVVDGTASYYFGDSTPVQINLGARYGAQYGNSSMVDDDISSEYMWDVESMLVNGATEDVYWGTPAVSVGTTSDGTQMGFNAGLGLTDLFDFGRAKITPSVGYRYFKHKVETKNNYGMMIQVLNSDSFVNCIQVQDGEIQCSPYVGFADGNGVVDSFAGFLFNEDGTIAVNSDGSYIILNDSSSAQLDLGTTYYYEQSGVSHKYETVWAGPYVALDMEYVMNDYNKINAGIEVGLPAYDSKGDQPYRFDWEHPTSVEDKAGIGKAIHFGFNTMWGTSLTDNIMLTLGMTYDYYRVKDADAKTYLNKTYYQGLLDDTNYAINYYEGQGSLTDDELIALNNYRAEKTRLEALKSNGWTLENNSEIKSIYKSMGIRLGLSAKF